MQAALAWWSTVSPFSPYGPTIALVFVLLVAALKAIIEDKKRHQEDRITNNSTAHVVQPDGEAPPSLMRTSRGCQKTGECHIVTHWGCWNYLGAIVC